MTTENTSSHDPDHNPDDDDNEGSPDPEIDPSDMETFLRGVEVTTRSPDAALNEMRNTTTAFDERLRELAQDFPGVAAVGVIVLGQSCGSLVFAQSSGFMHYLPTAMNRVRLLAQIISELDEDLLAAFEAELNHRKGVAALNATIKAIRQQDGAATLHGETS